MEPNTVLYHNCLFCLAEVEDLLREVASTHWVTLKELYYLIVYYKKLPISPEQASILVVFLISKGQVVENQKDNTVLYLKKVRYPYLIQSPN